MNLNKFYTYLEIPVFPCMSYFSRTISSFKIQASFYYLRTLSKGHRTCIAAHQKLDFFIQKMQILR